MGRIRPQPRLRRSPSPWKVTLSLLEHRLPFLRAFPCLAGNPVLVRPSLTPVPCVRKHYNSDNLQRFFALPPLGWPQPTPPPAPRPSNRCLPEGYKAAPLLSDWVSPDEA
ncbi:hypothetical protein E4T39_02389 [Aureobasidium subglaciale]|nr:hypothetical protein E4T39_02389 [Aureobasidium subglaciale]